MRVVVRRGFYCSIPFCLPLLKVVGYYDLSVLFMSVMGFQKICLAGGWVGELYPSCFVFLNFF